MTTAHTATADGTARPHNRIRVGYAGVSTRSQDHQAQLDALAAAHCREMVVETASTRGERPKLRAVLDRLQPDDTLVISGKNSVRGRCWTCAPCGLTIVYRLAPLLDTLSGGHDDADAPS